MGAMFWIIRRVWLPLVVQALWWGGRQIDWPRPMQLLFCVLAMVALAVVGQFMVYSTRNLGDEARWIEIVLLVIGWVSVLAIVVLFAVRIPLVGIVGGGFLIYAALDAFREYRDAFIRKIRVEHVALRPGDPNYRPAVVRRRK
jgi:hypothetical protein